MTDETLLTDAQIADLIGFASRCVLGYEPRDIESMARELQSRRYPCEWSEIEEGSDIFNTCKEGEEFHLTEGLELWPHCPWCGRKVEVVPLSNQE